MTGGNSTATVMIGKPLQSKSLTTRAILISAFVFATKIVQSGLFFLEASSHLPCLYSPVFNE